MKRQFVSCSSQNIGVCHTVQGHIGMHLGQAGGRNSGRKTWAIDFIVVAMGKEQVRQGKDLLVSIISAGSGV